MMKYLRLTFVLGIRSQIMKMAAFMQAIEEWNKKETERKIVPFIVYSGQHYDAELSHQYFSEYGITADIDLTGTYSSNEPAVILGEMITKLTDIFRSTIQDFVVVFGDANTTMAGAISAIEAKQKLIHVESGLRSGDKSQPEERNRVVTDHIADFHFVSSKVDQQNLLAEGIEGSYFSGDVIRDLIQKKGSQMPLGAPENRVLLTIHRAENLRDPQVLLNCSAAINNFGLRFLLVLHPRTKELVDRWNIRSTILSNGGKMLDSLPHNELLAKIIDSEYVVTDSGALQREAFYLGRRLLIVQEVPFWRSLVEGGFHRRVDATVGSIEEGLMWLDGQRGCRPPEIDDFGSGDAAQRILTQVWELYDAESF